jgi:hypothetical protein
MRTLLLLTALFPVVSLVARWLLTLPSGVAFRILVAMAIGFVIGMVVCFVTQHVTTGKLTFNVVLTLLVTFCGVRFADHFLIYLISLFGGVVAAHQGGTIVASLGRASGITVSSDDETKRQ